LTKVQNNWEGIKREEQSFAMKEVIEKPDLMFGDKLE